MSDIKQKVDDILSHVTGIIGDASSDLWRRVSKAPQKQESSTADVPDPPRNRHLHASSRVCYLDDNDMIQSKDPQDLLITTLCSKGFDLHRPIEYTRDGINLQWRFEQIEDPGQVQIGSPITHIFNRVLRPHQKFGKTTSV